MRNVRIILASIGVKTSLSVS